MPTRWGGGQNNCTVAQPRFFFPIRLASRSPCCFTETGSWTPPEATLGAYGGAKLPEAFEA
eukprot:15461353-Alexandrium_andersonii.AAC.1